MIINHSASPWELYPDLDQDRDPIGIVLKKSTLCGYCGSSMEMTNEGYICPICGFSLK